PSGLGDQGVGRRPRAERHDLEAVGLGADHVDRLRPDRPRGPGDGDGGDGHRARLSVALAAAGTAPAAGGAGHSRKKSLIRVRYHTAGRTKSRASNRSSRPPWAGRIVPMSLMPRSRLTRDSARSPSGATRATSTPTLSPSCHWSKGWTPTMANTTPATTASSMPPARPSMVLFGLAAERGRDPALRPTNRAPTS